MSRILIAFIAIACTINYSLTAECSKGCITCAQSHCFNCYQRPLKNSQECADTTTPEDKCDIYTFRMPGCDWCAKGYAIDAQTHQLPCTAQTDIPDCQVAFTLSGKTVCGICVGGFPSQDFSSCVPFSGETGVEKNCLWAGKDQQGAKECYRCKEGYTSVAGGCEKQTIEGCMYTGTIKTFCGICDAWNGWFALTDDGKCTKASDSSDTKGIAASGEVMQKMISKVKQIILKSFDF